jgi:hypothetical protein
VFFHVKPENLDLKIILATHAYNGIEVRYWRLEKLRSFDKFLTRRFPESPNPDERAPPLMSIHEYWHCRPERN